MVLTKEEALEITTDQYQMLMQGLEIVTRRPIEEVPDPEISFVICAKRRK